MSDVQSVLKDPDFLGLPPTEKVKVLARMDSDFAGLPASEQMKVIGVGQAPKQTLNPNQPGMQPISKGAGAMERAGIPTSKQQVYDAVTSGGDVPQALNSPEGMVAAQLLNAGKGIKQGLVSGFHDFKDAAENIKAGQPVLPNLGKALYGGVQGAVGGLLSPVGGQQLMNFGEDIHTGNYAGAGGGAGSLMFQAALAHGMTKLPELAAAISETNVANRTTKYANNLSGAIGETGKTMNVPAEAKNVIQDVRQVAANSGMTPADFQGAKASASVRQAIGKTLDAHEANYQQLFDSIRDNPVPDAVKARIKTAIGQEVNNAMETLMPEDANSINALKQRANNLETWNDINDARQLMNRASQAAWKKPDAMQMNSPNHTQALQTGSNVIRDELYGEIGKANGLSEDAVRALKQKEGSLLKLDAMVEGLENKTANAQGNWVSTTKLDKFRNGNYASVSSAVKDALLKQSPQDIVASKASRAFADLPAPNQGIGITPNIANMPQLRPQLPAQTGGAFSMGASEPGITVGERVAAQGQQLRQRQPLGLPEVASGRTDSVPLPDLSAMSPGEKVAAIQKWVRENQARLTNRKALPIQAEPKRLPASSLGRNK